MGQELIATNQAEVIPQQPLHLLIVDDVMADIELIAIALEAAGINFTYDMAQTATDCQNLLQMQIYDAMLSDYRLPTMNGLQALKFLQESGQDIPLILITGTLGEEAAVECIKAGMTDYVLKERLFRLPNILGRALEEFDLRRQKQGVLAQLKASAWREAAINHIVQTMRETLVLDEVLQTTADQLHLALQVSSCLILQPDGENQMLVSYVSAGTTEGQSLINLNVNFPVYYRQKLEQGYPLTLDRIDSSLVIDIEDLATKYNIKSIMIVPLRYQQSFMGAITLHQSDREREWTGDELALVRAIAEQCAIAIDQAKLYQQAQIEIAERQRMEIALRQAEGKYRGIFENAVEGIFQTTPQGSFLSANPALAQISGYESPEQLITQLTDIWTKLYLAPHRREQFIAIMQERGEVSQFESQVYRADGSVIWISENARAVKDDSGRLLYYEGFVKDITEHKQTESLLLGQTKMLEMLVTEAPLADVLDVLCRMVEDHSDGLTCAIYLKEWGQKQNRKSARQIKRQSSIPYVGWSTPIISESGKVLGTLTMYASQPRQPTARESRVLEIATRLAGIAIERKEVEQQLHYDAFHDALTKLYNRAWFMKQLEHAVDDFQIHQDQDFAVLFLDLDNFKVINDSLGHVIGDKLLIESGKRLKECLCSTDTVARLGGDEFAILIENDPDRERVCRLAEQIQQSLQVSLKIDTLEIFTTVSIGITFSSTGYERAEDLLRDADIALYRAKQQGKGCFVVFDRTMHEQAIARLKLETDLRYAIERSQLLLHYQPIVCLTGGHLVGFEALVRWQHPANGLISPYHFIPIAEETGLIIPLSWWVLRTACQQLQIWRSQFPTHPPLKMSVNLSGKQFAQVNFVEQVKQILLETNCNPHSLKLEITESTLMEGGESAVKMLEELRKIGIELSIDDFGTGYSSLSRLHQLPINTLKIDRTFVMGMSANSENIEIVRSIVSLGHNLGMDIVAEGVELSEQSIILKQLGCEYGQGYLFAKPMDSQAIAKLIATTPHWGLDAVVPVAD